MTQAFPSLFSGKLGCLKNFEIKLDIDPAVRPVKQKLRPIAIHLRDSVQIELEKQVNDGILERVDTAFGPTDWISNLVVIPKDKSSSDRVKSAASKQGGERILDVRLTCDSTALNKAIRRTRHPTKTIDDLVHMVQGATVFSKLDLNKAFHQLKIAEESRNDNNHTYGTISLSATPYGHIMCFGRIYRANKAPSRGPSRSIEYDR